MQDNSALHAHLYREKVAVTRQMTPEQRVLACFELTEFVRRTMIDGIRHQFPLADEQEVQRILLDRVNQVRALDERRFYIPSPSEP